MNAIWNTDSIRLLTSLCNISSNSVLHCFRLDYAVNGDRNLVGLSVVFQKSPSRHHKHKSPSTLRRNQLRKEIRRQRMCQQQGLGTQAPPRTQPSQPHSQSLIPDLISGNQTTLGSSSNTSSEHQTTTNTNASSILIDRHTNSASLPETRQLTGRPTGTTSSSVVSSHPNQATTSSSSSSVQSTRRFGTTTVSGPLLVPSTTLDDGALEWWKRPPSTYPFTSSSSSTGAKPSATMSSQSTTVATVVTSQPAFDPHASLPQLEASTRSESFHATIQSPLQSTTSINQTSTQFKRIPQACFSIGVCDRPHRSQRRTTPRYRSQTITPTNSSNTIEDL